VTEAAAPPDRFAAMRARLLSRVAGDVLEIGGGTGPSLEYYPGSVRLAFTEPDAGVLEEAAARNETPADTTFARAALPDLPFSDAVFDAVVEMRVLCSVGDAARAIDEIRRVLRPGGTLVFMEHGRSANPVWGLGQDLIAMPWRWYWGCWPNRDTPKLLKRAGFAIEWLERFGWGPPPVRPRVYGIARLE
jgi:SAM-dependent methyltransferase